MVTKFLIRKAFNAHAWFHSFTPDCSDANSVLNNSNIMVVIFTNWSSTFSESLFYTYLWGVLKSCILRSLWKHLKPSKSQPFSIICSLWTMHQIILHDFTSGGRMVAPQNALHWGTAWYITFLTFFPSITGNYFFPDFDYPFLTASKIFFVSYYC